MGQIDQPIHHTISISQPIEIKKTKGWLLDEQ